MQSESFPYPSTFDLEPRLFHDENLRSIRKEMSYYTWSTKINVPEQNFTNHHLELSRINFYDIKFDFHEENLLSRNAARIDFMYYEIVRVAREVFLKRIIATSLALHPRLGAGSTIQSLGAELFHMIFCML